MQISKRNLRHWTCFQLNEVCFLGLFHCVNSKYGGIGSEQREQLDAEHRERNIAYYQLKQEHDDLVEKMKFFTKESAVDLREIEEALVLIKVSIGSGMLNMRKV